MSEMLNASRLHLSNPQSKFLFNCNFQGNTAHGLSLRLPYRRNFASFTVQSVAEKASVDQSVNSELTSTIGFSSAIQQPLTPRHIRILSFFACAAALSATWLFCAAIPALLAFKRAAESMEKLMDVTREELPDTMAALRLSGMEISDLTMELSDLGQEITQGVRSSTRAVRLAEERLRRLTNMSAPTAYVQVAAPTETRRMKPVLLANGVRSVREGVVKGRSVVRIFFTLTHFSKMIFNFFRSRSKA